MTATTDTAPPRELDHRSTNGLEVSLMWYPTSGQVVVHVFDASTHVAHRVLVAPDQALDAFLHPFAYVAPSPATPAIEPVEAERLASLC